MHWRALTAAMAVVLGLSSCADDARDTRAERRPQTASAPTATARIDPNQAQRLRRIMPPLIAAMDKPIPANQVRIAVLADRGINAANGGGGDFYVTTGLLEQANDEHLRAILAHETAHADLGHVAKTQTVSTVLSLGEVLLDQFLPGAGAIAPLFSQAALNAYTRSEETEADAHAVQILRRAGRDGKAEMAGALTWLQQTSGDSGGGFFATHPATGDRIQAVRALP